MSYGVRGLAKKHRLGVNFIRRRCSVFIIYSRGGKKRCIFILSCFYSFQYTKFECVIIDLHVPFLIFCVHLCVVIPIMSSSVEAEFSELPPYPRFSSGISLGIEHGSQRKLNIIICHFLLPVFRNGLKEARGADGLRCDGPMTCAGYETPCTYPKLSRWNGLRRLRWNLKRR
ncbi:hypothetical protein B0T13DRAFT_318098 [Neurospora crassa]|nr:hypothetical protein B0T13DRAFT_318098 [Neurospora crassa]